MDDCCDWHAKTVGSSKQICDDVLVEESISFCPECHSMYKKRVALQGGRSFMTEQIWGDFKEMCMKKYEKEIEDIKS